MSDDYDEIQSAFAREVADARRQAEETMHEYDLERQLGGNEHEAHIRFNIAVTYYITKLIAYLRQRDEYAGTDLLPNDDGKKITMKDIIDKRGEYREDTVTNSHAMNRQESQQVKRPDLVDPRALRNAVYELNNVSLRCGFMPEAKPTVAHLDEAEV